MVSCGCQLNGKVTWRRSQIWVRYFKKGCRIDKNLKQDAKQHNGKREKANSVNPDETAHYEPSNLDLHCL